MVTLKLPFPPTVNNITAVVRGRKITSKRGRQYREQAMQLIKEQYDDAPLSGRLSVRIELHPPCRRTRDIDNYSKAPLDAITKAGLWLDDEQIDRLTVKRCEIVPGGACVVHIEEVE